MLIDKIDKDKLTPMMKQYIEIKNEYRDIILFYRLGDFYEMFFDDAILASRELEIALTGRDAGLDERIPMCGVPHHSADPFIARLIDKGHKIAIVEQLEDPSQAKGIVRRNVVKIISPGTIINMEGKDSTNNFLLSIFKENNSFSISYIDITTGEFNTSEIINSTDIYRDIIDIIVKVNPKEIVLNNKLDNKIFNDYVERNNIFITYVDIQTVEFNSALNNLSKKIKNINKTFYINKLLSIYSSNMLLDYIYLFRDEELNHIDNLEYIEIENFMKIDAHTRDNLEIHKNALDSTRKNSLISIMDKAITPMGSRKINSWLEFPLIDKKEINKRLDLVEYFTLNIDTKNEISSILNTIFDLERQLSKSAYKTSSPKDLLQLRNSFAKLPVLKDLLANSNNKILNEIGKEFDELADMYELINLSIREDAPIQITEGNIIKSGYNEELDHIKTDSVQGRKDLIEYEKVQRAKTGISKLKIGFNKNVGYYIEITNSYLDKVPENYIRRQTLKNAERFITQELNNISDMILGSQTQTQDLEYSLYTEIRNKISSNATRIKSTSETIAFIDSIISFATIAIENGYTRPIFNNDNYILIKDGRHPVVEKSIGSGAFISNDTLIGKNNKLIQIITGPNMAGKSTYMRQVALILLMAQVGSFVPAKACDISISKSLFTRIGASDNLAKGESTFMVEMNEMSNIIKNADENSFVILDEVGRGTSTNDGYSIAKSIIEYMSKNNKSKTLFATHYHELTDLENSIDNIENLKVSIMEDNGEIIFLRKIVKGKTDKSYGIEVAKLSGIPEEIIFRANTILNSLDMKIEENEQLSFTTNNDYNIDKELLLKEIEKIDINNLTPISALEKLDLFNKKAKEILND